MDYYTKTREFLESDSSPINTVPIDFRGFEDDLRLHIARNLTSLRKDIGFTQPQFANFLEISLSQYKKYETSSEIIRFDISQRISLKLGYPNMYLLRNSKFHETLRLPTRLFEYGKMWYFANSLLDEKFEQFCKMLTALFDISSPMREFTPSGITKRDFNIALEENENSIYCAISHGLRAIRHHINLSQQEVADLIGVSVNTYQEYEKPDNKPRFNIAVASRYLSSIQVNPLYIIAFTSYTKIRMMQNTRMEALQDILKEIKQRDLDLAHPVIDSFFCYIRNKTECRFYPVYIKRALAQAS